MRRRISRISLIAVIVIVAVCVCAGVAIHAVRHADEKLAGQRDFNLYTLVPRDATVVVETDCMGKLIQDIDRMPCSQDGHYLYVSDLFVLLKAYYYTLVERAPHGLSHQMNRMLLSFHEPDSPRSQVLYCNLGPGDLEMMQTFVGQFISNDRLPQSSRYQGVTLHEYPMADGGTLTAYYTSRFLVISLERSLVEAVVDAHRTHQSLMQWPNFQSMHPVRELGSQATVFVRMKSVDMGQEPAEEEGAHRHRRLPPVGSWAEFSLRLSGEGIYCSGLSHELDTVHTFIGMLSQQEPLVDFPGDRLPSTTFFCNHIALTDREALRDFAYSVDSVGVVPALGTDSVAEPWLDLVLELADGELLTCLFLSPDEREAQPEAVLSMPVSDERLAQERLRALQAGRPSGMLTGRYPYARVYRGQLLMASSERGLSAYVDRVERGDVLGDVPLCQETLAKLSPAYHFLMMADMEAVSQWSVGPYVRTIPALFFRHAKFFRHFLVAVQMTTSEGAVFPNLVLVYKREGV